MKRCATCEIEKEDAMFVYGKATRIHCRDCHNKKRRELAVKYKETAEKIKKTCTECKEEKDGKAFAYSCLICKKCKSERDKEENHRAAADDPPKTCTKCSKEQPAKEFRYQSKVCISCEKERLYEWRKENPDKFKTICKTYREKPDYREKQNSYKKTRYDVDKCYKLETLFRNRIRMYIKGGIKKGNKKYLEMLGCDWDTLRKWLELNMTDEMTWENHGTLWHIDHTMPCSIFDFGIEENVKTCFNWSNLAPMLGVENLTKSNKLDMALVAKYKEKARVFIADNKGEILTDALPTDLRNYVVVSEGGDVSGVLDTKVTPKGGAGT